MVLFPKRHTDRETVEACLRRKLTGDPSRGELAVLAALARDDMEAARLKLGGTDIGPDFLQLIAPTTRSRPGRADGRRFISIGVPQATWDVYAKEAHRTARLPSDCLLDAIERDRRIRADAADVAGGLQRQVTEFIEAAREILSDLRAAGGGATRSLRPATSPSNTEDVRSARLEAAHAHLAALRQVALGLDADLDGRLAETQAKLDHLRSAAARLSR